MRTSTFVQVGTLVYAVRYTEGYFNIFAIEMAYHFDAKTSLLVSMYEMDIHDKKYPPIWKYGRLLPSKLIH